jgi:hypothetical protein
LAVVCAGQRVSIDQWMITWRLSYADAGAR